MSGAASPAGAAQLLLPRRPLPASPGGGGGGAEAAGQRSGVPVLPGLRRPEGR